MHKEFVTELKDICPEKLNDRIEDLTFQGYTKVMDGWVEQYEGVKLFCARVIFVPDDEIIDNFPTCLQVFLIALVLCSIAIGISYFIGNY